MPRIKLFCLLFLLPLLFCAAERALANTVNEIVAVVNGEAITRFDLQKRQDSPFSSGIGPGREEAERRKQILKSMVNEILFRQEAERLGITVSDAQVQNRLDMIREKNNLSRQELDNYLEQQGMDPEEFRQRIREKIRIQRLLSSMVRQKVVVTDKELRRYYQEHKWELSDPGQLRLSLIVMSDRKRLKKVRQEIQEGEMGFAEGAKQYSRGPRAQQGGDLGSMQWGDLSQAVREAVQGLDAGQMSSVFQLRGNYALLRLESREAEEGGSFERVREEVREKVFSRKVKQRYQEYVQKLRSEALIEVRL